MGVLNVQRCKNRIIIKRVYVKNVFRHTNCYVAWIRISSYQPMRIYLQSKGYTNIHAISYDPNNQGIMEATQEASQKLMEKIDISQEIVVIGHPLTGCEE